MEDGCGEQANVFETMQPAPVTLVVQGTDADSCKLRRKLRMDALRAKRAGRYNVSRPRHMASIPTHSVGPVSADSSTVTSVSTYALTKDELRRKKNRESAERSRLRKLALIDFLSSQVTELSAKLHRLTVLNQRLRSGEVVPAGLSVQCSHSRSETCSDCESVDGDLSTISGTSTPHKSRSKSSASRLPTGKSFRSTNPRKFSVSSNSSASSDDGSHSGMFADSFPSKRQRSQAAHADDAVPSSSSAARSKHDAGAAALDAYLAPHNINTAVSNLEVHQSFFPGDVLGGGGLLENDLLFDGLLDFELCDFPLTGLP